MSAAELLREAVQARADAEVAEVVAIAALAEEHEWDDDSEFDVTSGAVPRRIGADGTPLLDEFLPLEVAALKGVSVITATWLIRDVINLHTRHPKLWLALLTKRVPVFRACQLAQEAARVNMNLEQTLRFDDELDPQVGVLPWRRLLQLARGLIADIAAEQVAIMAECAREARFVHKHETESPAVAYLSARVDTADAVFFDAMVDRIADILGSRGDADTKDIRRAKAVGILATPARAALLLAEQAGYRGGKLRADSPKLLPEVTVYVHVAEETVMAGRGPCRVEGVGALTFETLKQLLGKHRVRLTPVVQPRRTLAVDCYEIPERIRAQVLLRDLHEVFPYSSRSARGCQLDHTRPYVEGGPPGQTNTGNLGPLSNKAHRAKTFNHWTLEQPKPGVFWWTSPSGDIYRVGPNGTMNLGRPNESDDLKREMQSVPAQAAARQR